MNVWVTVVLQELSTPFFDNNMVLVITQLLWLLKHVFASLDASLHGAHHLLAIFADGLLNNMVSFINLYDYVISSLNELHEHLLPNIHYLFECTVIIDNNIQCNHILYPSTCHLQSSSKFSLRERGSISRFEGRGMMGTAIVAASPTNHIITWCSYLLLFCLFYIFYVSYSCSEYRYCCGVCRLFFYAVVNLVEYNACADDNTLSYVTSVIYGYYS